MATETGTRTSAADGRVLNPQRVERLLRWGLWGAAGAIMLFLWVPLLAMIFLSFAENASTFLPFEGFTLRHYTGSLGNPKVRAAVRRSVLIATLSASVATVLGVLASFAIARYRFRLKQVYRTFGILPMVIPGVVLGIALRIYFDNLVTLSTGLATIVLTHSVYGFPFVLLIVTARLYTFDEALEEAARDLGADPLTVFRDVTFPLIAPAVGAGFLFAWIRSFEDYIRVFFVKNPPAVLTTFMFSKIKNGVAPRMNAISALIVFVIAVALAVAMNLGNVTGYVAGTVEDDAE